MSQCECGLSEYSCNYPECKHGAADFGCGALKVYSAEKTDLHKGGITIGQFTAAVFAVGMFGVLFGVWIGGFAK